MKSYDFEAVVYDGEIYCRECCPVPLDSEEVSPIFADQEWDYAPTCNHCGAEHDYMTILEPTEEQIERSQRLIADVLGIDYDQEEQ
jgi:hypothetical protein